jgi:hypothetical protein
VDTLGRIGMVTNLEDLYRSLRNGHLKRSTLLPIRCSCLIKTSA